MTRKELEEKKNELKRNLDTAKTEEEVSKIEKEYEKLEKENVEEDTETDKVENTEKNTKETKEIISKEDERSLIAGIEDNQPAKIRKILGGSKMEENKKFTIKSPEYRSAWAKTLMGMELSDVEKRALGDAIGTTATDFVQSTADVQGVNNLGLLIPESVNTSLLERASEESPIFRDIRKLNVDGVIDLPYLFNADDAVWVEENKETPNEGQKYKGLKLTGHELAKDVVITWKADAMTVDGFIDFITDEIYEKMFKAKVDAVIHGNGETKPKGIAFGKDAKTGASAIEVIHTVLKSMSKEAKKGSKIYVASSVSEDMTFYKDENGNYPYLISGITKTNKGKIEEDPYLNDGEIIIGNMKNYIFNENKPISISKETTIKGRKVTYGGYQIVDGAPRPDYFGYGKVLERV